MIEYNTVIIGAGISGMTAAIYLKRAGLSTLIIENNAPGGQLMKGFDIENYPGFLKINSTDLALNIYNQTTSLEVDYLFEEISNIDLNKKIINTLNNKIKAKYIVIATGRKEKKLLLENEEKLIGKGLSFCATCDGAFYKNKDVVIVGGGNTAITEALYLSNICNKVNIIVRKDKLRAENILQERVRDLNNINIIYNKTVEKYNIKDNKLISISLNDDNEILCEGVFLALGFIPNTELFEVIKEKNYIKVDENFMTNIENVYACGDVVFKNIYQLTTSTSDATIASTSIIEKENKKNF